MQVQVLLSTPEDDLSAASIKIEMDREPTETVHLVITCTRMGCRRPVRPELLDHTFLPLCDEHQGLLVGDQRWGVYHTAHGWLVDVAEGVYLWDAESCRQWGTPEVVYEDLAAAGFHDPPSFAVMRDGTCRMETGLLVLRMR